LKIETWGQAGSACVSGITVIDRGSLESMGLCRLMCRYAVRAYRELFGPQGLTCLGLL